jgi:hypothetical protein
VNVRRIGGHVGAVRTHREVALQLLAELRISLEENQPARVGQPAGRHRILDEQPGLGRDDVHDGEPVPAVLVDRHEGEQWLGRRGLGYEEPRPWATFGDRGARIDDAPAGAVGVHRLDALAAAVERDRTVGEP